MLDNFPFNASQFSSWEVAVTYHGGDAFDRMMVVLEKNDTENKQLKHGDFSHAELLISSPSQEECLARIPTSMHFQTRIKYIMFGVHIPKNKHAKLCSWMVKM